MRLPLLTALVLLLAGCAAPAADTDLVDGAGLPTEPAPLARVLTVLDVEGGMGEPSLGVTPEGVLFANGRDHPDQGPDSGAVFRSVDGGATWEKLAAPTAPMPNFDPDLAVDADGTVWFDTLWIGCTSVAVSRDLGDSWSFNPLACVPPAGDRQYVIPTKGGVAYAYAHHLPTFYQMAVKTTDHGATWLPTGPVETPDHHLLLNEGSGWGGGGFWNPVTDSVFLTFTWDDADGWHPAYAVTRDGGASWEIGALPNEGGRRHGLSLVVGAADDAGNVHLAWSETAEDGDSGVYLASSTDDGRTWSAAKRVDDGNLSNVFPAITASGDGGVAVAWYEADEPGYPSDASDASVWHVRLAWTRDALSEAPAFGRGQLSLAPAKVGPICPDGTTCQGNRQLLDYFSVKTLPDGRVAALWASTEEIEGKVANVFAATDAAVLPPRAAAPPAP